jgi:hypothetical protein
MQRELSELKPQLVLAASKTQDMMREIEEETVKVEAASAQVRSDEKVANLQAAAAEELKRECEADLAQAIPILEGNVQDTTWLIHCSHFCRFSIFHCGCCSSEGCFGGFHAV